MIERLASSRMQKRGDRRVDASPVVGDAGLEPNPYENNPNASNHLVNKKISSLRDGQAAESSFLPAVSRVPDPSHNFTHHLAVSNHMQVFPAPGKIDNSGKGGEKAEGRTQKTGAPDANLFDKSYKSSNEVKVKKRLALSKQLSPNI